MTCVHRRRSAITKLAARVSQEQSDLESPNFTQTSIPVWSIATPDITSPATSGRHFNEVEKRPKWLSMTALDQILVAWRFVWPNKCVGFLSSVLTI